jgi:hypothetical protein
VSKTYATILGERLGELAGPRVAAMMLRKVAADRNDTDSYLALTNEINRLTNVIARSPEGGWIPLPFNVAKAQGIFDPEDLSEVENAIVFFTVASAMLRKAGAARDPAGCSLTLGCADICVELYGVRRFLADLDRDRQYWRDDTGVCGAVLDWAMTEGFDDFFGRHGWSWRSAHGYRQRYVTWTLEAMAKRRF